MLWNFKRRGWLRSEALQETNEAEDGNEAKK
jgi:hypothetical protein